MAEDKLGIHILGPTYFGARQVGLKPNKKINTPGRHGRHQAAHAGRRRLAVPRQALGANPTPMAYAEVYTGLQTGAIDGQDNPLPNVQNMKFYEVMSQIVLTSHLVGFDLLTISSKAWNAMTPEQQTAFQAAADKAIDWSQAEHLKQEEELVAFFKEQGARDLYARRRTAFRELRAEEVSRVRSRQELARRHGRQDQRALRPEGLAARLELRQVLSCLCTCPQLSSANNRTWRCDRHCGTSANGCGGAPRMSRRRCSP